MFLSANFVMGNVLTALPESQIDPFKFSIAMPNHSILSVLSAEPDYFAAWDFVDKKETLCDFGTIVHSTPIVFLIIDSTTFSESVAVNSSGLFVIVIDFLLDFFQLG